MYILEFSFISSLKCVLVYFYAISSQNYPIFIKTGLYI